MNFILDNNKPWKRETWIVRCRDFRRQWLRTEGQILHSHPTEELNNCMIGGEWQTRTRIPVSMNNPSTEAVFRFACRAIRSEYSWCSSDVKCDKRGASIGGPSSTRSTQSSSQTCLPTTFVESPSGDGIDKLRSSFPILSACLWKNWCSTTASVSSDVMPSHWSLPSSLVADLYFVSVKRSSHCRESTTHMHLGEKSSDICNIIFQEFIKNRHVSFFAEEYVVCQILDDFRNDHQTPTQYHVVFLRYLNIDCLRWDHSRRNEALHHSLGRNQMWCWFGLTAEKWKHPWQHTWSQARLHL